MKKTGATPVFFIFCRDLTHRLCSAYFLQRKVFIRLFKIRSSNSNHCQNFILSLQCKFIKNFVDELRQATDGVPLPAFEREVKIEQARKVAAEIGGVACPCDITDSASLQAAIDQAAAAHGPARILMSIAGIGTAKRVVGKDGQAAPLEDFVRVIQVNLIGTYNASRLFAAACAKLDPLPEGERGVMVSGQTVIVRDGRIAAVGPAASTTVPAGATVIDAAGKTIKFDLVGTAETNAATGRVDIAMATEGFYFDIDVVDADHLVARFVRTDAKPEIAVPCMIGVTPASPQL